MRIPFIDFKREYKARKNIYDLAYQRVLSKGYFILGEEVEKFEEEFAGYLGVKYCIGVANGLEALQIALLSLGIKPGQEVITTPLSAMATVLAILAVGAVPVFVDIKENGQINENQIEKVINGNTFAVIPVHLYGIPANISKIKEICRRYNLFLIEDAAQAHGSESQGRKLGTFGDFGCFSFYPTKNLGAFGDAGAIVTNNKQLFIKARKIRNYGQEEQYNHVVFGLNSRLDELQAAFLREKLRFLDEDNEKRRRMAKLYIELLKEADAVECVQEPYINESNNHIFIVRVRERRDELRNFLKKMAVDTLIHYPKPLYKQKAMERYKFKITQRKVVEDFCKTIVSLPLYPFLQEEEVRYIAENIKKFYKLKI